MGQHENIQDDGEVENRTQKCCSWNEQQQRRNHLDDANERIVETREEQSVEIMAQGIIRWQAGEPLSRQLYNCCRNESESQGNPAKESEPPKPLVSPEVVVSSL